MSKSPGVPSENLARSKTRVEDATGAWYTLDNAAVIMPAVSDRVATSLFRVSATLDAPIRLPEFGKALSRTCGRFPYFLVELRRGIFWYYFEPASRPVEPEADAAFPCQDYRIRKRGSHLFRVRLSGARVACEFSHVLTDGTGGFVFLKTLLSEYVRELGADPGVAPDVPDAAGRPDAEEYEDAYQRYYREGLPHPEKLPRAFHDLSPLLPRYRYRVISGIFPLEKALAVARDRGASLTELLCAAAMDAFVSVRNSYPEGRRRRTKSVVAVEVPVNMRRFYPTKTLRNFTLFVLPSVDLRLGSYSFEDMVRTTHHTMGLENDERKIARQISRNAGGTRILAVRLVPLVVKDFFARILFNVLGEGLITTFVSNLGEASFPGGVAGRVRRVDFIPAPSRTTKTNFSIVSWNGEVVVSAGSLSGNTAAETFFFRRLASLGIPVRIESNMEREE